MRVRLRTGMYLAQPLIQLCFYTTLSRRRGVDEFRLRPKVHATCLHIIIYPDFFLEVCVHMPAQFWELKASDGSCLQNWFVRLDGAAYGSWCFASQEEFQILPLLWWRRWNEASEMILGFEPLLDFLLDLSLCALCCVYVCVCRRTLPRAWMLMRAHVCLQV